MVTEADTSRTLIMPRLQAAGWESDRVKKQPAAMLSCLKPGAQEILADLLEKDARDVVQFTLPDVLKPPPICERGSIREILELFGSAASLKDAVDQLAILILDGLE